MGPEPLLTKTIILGVTGSIAAVKSPIVARELMRNGATVLTALTPAATRFVTPLAMSALTHERVITEALPKDADNESTSGTWHIALARKAAAMLIAPCSATTLGKLAAGIYDNAVTLLASALPQSTPLVLAPAMDEEMWLQPAVQENIRRLKDHGVFIIEPTSGLLASGLTGEGRMLEPEDLVSKLIELLQPAEHPLEGKHVLITGGPTYEPIDAVRFIGNRASGKMAVALGTAAAELGAEVTLIMGPSAIATNGNMRRIDIETADEMQRMVDQEFGHADIIIMNAAVSDFMAANPTSGKLKKRDLSDEQGNTTLELKQTPDILNSLGRRRQPGQFLVGFALELGDEAEEYAKGKMVEKGLDMIVLNRADESGAGFGVDTNKVTMYFAHGEAKEELPLLTKEECAHRILRKVVEKIG